MRACADPWFDDFGRRDGFTWKEYGYRFPVEAMAATFTFVEMVQIWIASFVMTPLSAWFEEHHPILEKIRHSWWHHAFHTAHYVDVVTMVAALRRMSWPGFTLRIGCSSKWRQDGWSEQARDVWIDNDLAVFVHDGDKHVMTIGFGVGNAGVYITQIQLRHAKGNRFLYRLRQHYVDAAVDVFAAAFGSDRLWLVDGTSAVHGVRRAYGSSPCSMTEDVAARMAATYDRPLVAWGRGDAVTIGGHSYRQLIPNSATMAG